MDDIGDDVIQQTLIVGHQQNRPIRAAHGVHAARDDSQGVDIEPRIGFIEDRQRRFEHRHLKDLVPLLFAAGKPFVDRPVQQRLVHVQPLHPVADQRHEVHRVELFLAPVLPQRIQRRLQEVRVVHARNLDRVLKGHEHAFPRPHLGIHRKKILASVRNRPLGDGVLRMPGEHTRERALARPVWTHDGVHLADVDRQVDTTQDVAVPGPYVQVLDPEHGLIQRCPPR